MIIFQAVLNSNNIQMQDDGLVTVRKQKIVTKVLDYGSGKFSMV